MKQLLMHKKKKTSWAHKAQTASELAVFGTVLLFVLTWIIRSSVSFNYSQSQSLKAFRLALKESYLSGEAQNNSRSFASVLFVEDRLDTDITGGGVTSSSDGKYGAIERNPYIVAGSGSFTKNLFLDPAMGEWWNLPVMDVFINGKHFTFTTGEFREISFWNKDTGWNYPDKNPNCVNQPDRRGDDDHICAVVYTKIDNGDPRFCCAAQPCPGGEPEEDKRFDLDRDGDADVNQSDRCSFSWQWLKVDATTKTFTVDLPTADVDRDLKEEKILMVKHRRVYYREDSEWDERRPDEPFETGKAFPGSPLTRPITSVKVLDFQAGDIDLSYNSADKRGFATPVEPNRKPVLVPGLAQEATMYTWTKTAKGGGTYLLLEEGKLYQLSGDTKQYVRNIQKTDRIDIIERTIQLSNDTGRMNPHVRNPVNPAVEAYCKSDTGGNCCFGENIFKTCFNRTSKRLYVRSRIKDYRGRKWITRVDEEMPVR